MTYIYIYIYIYYSYSSIFLQRRNILKSLLTKNTVTEYLQIFPHFQRLILWVTTNFALFQFIIFSSHRPRTRFLTSSSNSFLALTAASFVPMTVMSSWSVSLDDGKMTRAPVFSRRRRTLAPPRPIRNLWYSGLALTSSVKLCSFCYREKSGLLLNCLSRTILKYKLNGRKLALVCFDIHVSNDTNYG